ncbi:hypothetical protein NL676_017399 [Syzygium grande]|nr:hypothetical protein NL676_017399 [Syzygium grande]
MRFKQSLPHRPRSAQEGLGYAQFNPSYVCHQSSLLLGIGSRLLLPTTAWTFGRFVVTANHGGRKLEAWPWWPLKLEAWPKWIFAFWELHRNELKVWPWWSLELERSGHGQASSSWRRSSQKAKIHFGEASSSSSHHGQAELSARQSFLKAKIHLLSFEPKRSPWPSFELVAMKLLKAKIHFGQASSLSRVAMAKFQVQAERPCPSFELTIAMVSSYDETPGGPSSSGQRRTRELWLSEKTMNNNF